MSTTKQDVLAAAAAERLPISDGDQKEIEQLYNALRRGTAKLVGPDGQARHLPDSLYAFLVELIGRLNEGQSVYIIQNQAKISTIEAAAMLGVSRQFLVNILEKGEIPYHMVGSHRRIYAQDLLAYKAGRDKGRRKALRDLAQQEAKEGIYEKIPPVVTSDED
ncbi:MAG TPA: excisionase family DNA-binding protein [Bryobacteraceae bacterium]|nr:excisionase family DNA-binding protein [Bryobacteraceae bacterium]